MRNVMVSEIEPLNVAKQAKGLLLLPDSLQIWP
nr:MAG TPA: hypothetical protein [Caudoviricetes sp.]